MYLEILRVGFLTIAAYFDMLSLDLSGDKAAVLDILLADGMLSKSEIGNYNITNLGAVLFAKKIADFPSL